VRDDRVLEALVDQGLADCAGARGDLVQQGDPGRVLVRRRGQDHDGDDQPEDVHGQAPLAAGHLFPASFPVVPDGTEAAACTLWVSSTTRDGSAFRPFFSRACHRSRSWMAWSVPSSRHFAK
jgi:hypothetical protein